MDGDLRAGPFSPGRPYSLLCVEAGQTDQRRDRRVAAAYVALFLLGFMQGLIGCFQFAHTLGKVPVLSLAFCALILVTCIAGAAGMGTALGGVLPAIGWMTASFVLSMPVASGTVIITNTTAGKWYLYGGTVSALAGVGLSLAVLSFRGGARGPRTRPR